MRLWGTAMLDLGCDLGSASAPGSGFWVGWWQPDVPSGPGNGWKVALGRSGTCSAAEWLGGEARRTLPGEQDDEPEQGVPAVAAVTQQLYPVRTWPLVSRTTPAFHQLRVVMGAVTKVALTGGRLVVAAPVSSAAAVRRAVVTWYRHHAAERLLERAAIWAKKMGVPLPLVLIRDQRRRWGSCDPKDNLRFNWRIVQAPMRLVEYVVAHELVHLGHRKHTTAFWAALGRVMPDYEARRERLCQVRRRFEW